MRHGKLVFERYFNGSDASEASTIASASKSILSVATGIAIDEGLLGSTRGSTRSCRPTWSGRTAT